MKISFAELHDQFRQILLKYNFPGDRAILCARLFAENSRDGISSHGVNRFPVFIKIVNDGFVRPDAKPEKVGEMGVVEFWDGQLAPGMWAATVAMDQAIELARKNGMGCVSLKNTNHWMRGGSYGWQAADAGCIGICSSNTIANMPPWGGKEPRLGNNPLVIAIPRKDGHIVLDMAISQFSYGKLQEFELRESDLPVMGGYNEEGELTANPFAIRASRRTLPIGFWKGSGLSFILDVLVASLSGGRSVAGITANGREFGLSQIFICIDGKNLHEDTIESIIAYAKSSAPAQTGQEIFYPGEKTLATRRKSEAEGIEVNEEIWNQILAL